MKEEVLELLRKHTRHEFVALTPKGNASVYAAFETVRQLSQQNVVLIPDQGGWVTYRQIPRKMKMLAFEYKTDYGVLDAKGLPLHLQNVNSLIYSNPAGYYADQQSQEIYKECSQRFPVIMEVSGCLGSETCDGRHADIMIGSFGKWKPISIGTGGFISFKAEEAYKAFLERKEHKEPSIEETKLHDLYAKLEAAPSIYKRYYEAVQQIKKDLGNFEVLHPKSQGINVIVKFNTEDEKKLLVQYCEKNKYEYKLCPRYIRVNENALSIEVKHT